jgi:general secretion pathway protein K
LRPAIKLPEQAMAFATVACAQLCAGNDTAQASARFACWPRFTRLKAEHGFVMVVVIAAIGLLAMAASIFVKVTRTQVRASAIAAETARANALAAAGINLAVLKLLAFRSQPSGKHRNFAIGGQAFSCLAGGDLLVTEARDEGGKIDLNFAGERLLRALLIGLDVEPARTDAIVDAILDYRDGDGIKRPKGAEEAEYHAAGRAQGPKNVPFAAMEELGQVLGIDAALLEKLTPFVTAHSGKEGVDPAAAPRRLIEVLRRGDTPTPASETSLDLQSAELAADLPPYFTAHSTRNTFTVRSEVAMAGGLRFALEAIVDISSLRPAGSVASAQTRPVSHVWRWRRVPSSDQQGAFIGAVDALAQCELLAPI